MLRINNLTVFNLKSGSVMKKEYYPKTSLLKSYKHEQADGSFRKTFFNDIQQRIKNITNAHGDEFEHKYELPVKNNPIDVAEKKSQRGSFADMEDWEKIFDDELNRYTPDSYDSYDSYIDMPISTAGSL